MKENNTNQPIYKINVNYETKISNDSEGSISLIEKEVNTNIF
jgi:hypothetical protein